MEKRHFTREELYGLAAVLFVIILIVVLLRLYKRETTGPSNNQASNAQQELSDFEAQIKKDSLAWVKQHPHWNNEKETGKLFSFDPNTASYETFMALGFAPWQAKNALKYRAKGGRWKSAEHFSHLYGLSEKDFARLRPYIIIHQESNERTQYRSDSIRRQRVEKYAPGTKIDINAADTNALKKIPGIGSYYAGKIVRYRERLGGFVSKQQLKEIDGLPENIEQWFLITKLIPNQVYINKVSFKQLIRHPYFNYEQTKAIINHIRLNGPIKSWEELRFLGIFTKKELERLYPYVAFS